MKKKLAKVIHLAAKRGRTCSCGRPSAASRCVGGDVWVPVCLACIEKLANNPETARRVESLEGVAHLIR
jgi:hypothetical protein